MYKIAPYLIKLVLAFCLIISFLSAVHASSLEGVIIDQQSNEPLSGVNIYIKDLKTGTISDQFGKFYLQSPDKQKYKVVFSSIGYESVTQEIDFSAESNNFRLEMLPGDIKLDEIVIAGDNKDALSEIGKIDIKLRPITNSQEVLELIPGLFIAQHAGGGKAEQIFLRGFDLDHGTDIALFADGVPINMVSHAHGQGYSDLHFIIPETIEKVNFQKGAYNAQFGNFSTAGSADFQLKKNIRQNQVKIEAGQFDSYRIMGMINLFNAKKNKVKQSAYIATEYYFSNGFFEAAQELSRKNVFANYHLNIDNKNIIDLSASLFDSDWKASGQIPVRAIDDNVINRFGAIDNRERGDTGNKRINLNWKTLFGNKVSMSNQFYYINYDFDLYSNFTFFLNNEEEGDLIRQKEIRNIFGYKGSVFLESTVANKKLLSEVGFQIRKDNVDNSRLSNLGLSNQLLNYLSLGDVNEENWSVYLNQTITLTPKLNVNASLRYDHFRFNYKNKLDSRNSINSENENVLLPKISIDYVLNQKLKFYFKYGTGFHSNDSRVIHRQASSNLLAKAWSKDIGIEMKPLPSLIIYAGIWHLKSEDELVYVGDEGIVESSGPAERKGFDFSLRYQFHKAVYFDMDFNFSEAQYINEPSNESFVPLAPRFTSSGGINFDFDNGIKGSLRYRYLGDRPANESNSLIADGYFISDFKISYERKKYEFGLSVENIFDTKWKEAQFETTSRLQNEVEPVSEIHFTPGNPFFARAFLSFRF